MPACTKQVGIFVRTEQPRFASNKLTSFVQVVRQEGFKVAG